MTSGAILAVRALNHWRPLNLATYLGVRLLLEAKVAQRTDNKWLHAVLARKGATRSKARYRRFYAVKNASATGKIEYREFAAASPTAALIEARILDMLSKEPAFQTSPRSYSYLWPREADSARSFAFYRDGYDERNEAIHALLTRRPDLHAHVFDVKSFYPSIDKAGTRETLDRKLSRTALSPDSRQLVRAAIERYLAATGGTHGIALGPPISHLLGHLVLDNLDSVFAERFGERYFRYVDDIIVVAPRYEYAKIEGLLRSELKKKGLDTHPDKADHVSADEWTTYGPRRRTRSWDGSFEGFFTRICLRMALFPEVEDSLCKAFEDAGLTIPVRRLALLSAQGRFRLLWHSLARERRKWVARALADSTKALVSTGLRLREQLTRELEKETGARPGTANPTLRKWRRQRLQYAANRLFYLLPRAEYVHFADTLARVPETLEARTLLTALTTMDATALLPLPGPAISTFCELASERNLPVSVEWPRALEAAEFDSALVLATYGLADPPAHVVSRMSDEDIALLSFARGDAVKVRTLGDLSFVDELESLRLVARDARVQTYLETRFDEREHVSLEALALGLHGYS